MRPKSKVSEKKNAATGQQSGDKNTWSASREEVNQQRKAPRPRFIQVYSLFFFFPPCHVSIRPRIHQYVQLACITAETPRDEDASAAAALATFPVASRQNLTTIHHTGTTFSPIHPSKSTPEQLIHPPTSMSTRMYNCRNAAG